MSRSITQPTRRTLLRAGAAAPVAYAAGSLLSTAPANGARRSSAIADLERTYGATIGVAAWNVRTGERLMHRGRTRFPLCSVFKPLVAANILRDRDRHGQTLDRRVFYPRRDVLEYAPVTRTHVKDGMLVRELCEAAITVSDNTAGNLLLREVGGPQGLTDFFRSLGDKVTRLDRWETALNSAVPGDPRDTTTPHSIASLMVKLLVGHALNHRDRHLLRGWMLANQTSDDKFRAGLPQGWRLADKTGSGSYGTSNDVGVAWSPSGDPVVIAALTRRDEEGAETTDPAVHADIAALVAKRLG